MKASEKKIAYHCQRCGAVLFSKRNLGGVYTSEGPACACDIAGVEKSFKVRAGSLVAA